MRRKVDQSVRKHIYIPESITNEIEVLLCDPISGDVRYGTWSDLVTKLLKEWLETQRKPKQELTPEEVDEVEIMSSPPSVAMSIGNPGTEPHQP